MKKAKIQDVRVEYGICPYLEEYVVEISVCNDSEMSYTQTILTSKEAKKLAQILLKASSVKKIK